MDRRMLIVAVLVLTALGSVAASDADIMNFEPKAFAAAQAAGQGIVVFVHASW